MPGADRKANRRGVAAPRPAFLTSLHVTSESGAAQREDVGLGMDDALDQAGELLVGRPLLR
jgi:hypothetical protein